MDYSSFCGITVFRRADALRKSDSTISQYGFSRVFGAADALAPREKKALDFYLDKQEVSAIMIKLNRVRL